MVFIGSVVVVSSIGTALGAPQGKLTVTETKLTPNDGGDSSFGVRLDISGNTAIVGRPTDGVQAYLAGSAYVFSG